MADTFAIEVSNGPCITHDTIVITGIFQPAVWLGNDSTFCEDYPLTLNAEAIQNNSYLWSTGDTTATIITQGSNIYRVEVSNVCGTVSDEIAITNYPCSWQLFAPSSFTPNDDDFNPGWYVTGYNIETIDVRIYNRLGDAIFHTTTWEEAWKPSESIGDDIYNYRIDATTFNGEQVIQTGTIYLLR
jgi:gliding motility-associated-like protein